MTRFPRVAAFAATVLVSTTALAAPKEDPTKVVIERAVHPDRGRPDPAVTGVVKPARESSDAARTAANVALWLPREFVGLLFLTTGAAAGMLENEQVVPRLKELLFTRDGSIGVYPTFFLETGTSPNVGARMVAAADNEATMLRAGYGGADANVLETRLRFGRTAPFPTMLSIEGLHERRTGVGYLGLGQTPETDPRNRFASDLRSLSFRDRRERVIASLGIRPATDVELFVSSSYTQRYPHDLPDGDGPEIDRVFQPGSVPGLGRTTRFVYTELAVRLDTRAVRAAPSPGLVLESYLGGSRGVLDEPGRFARLGARAAGFISIARRTNILSPKLVIDGVAPTSGGEISVLELSRQPDFRGFNNRRDYVSMVGSLDYRWKLASFLAARLFTDVATVGPSVRELAFGDLRWVGGFGFDLYSDNAEVARFSLAGSPEGALFQLSFGVAPRFGDRQHRD